MSYHPIIGIFIFVFAIIFSFLLGRRILKKNQKLPELESLSIKKTPPKGDITSPDAPWLKDS